LIGFVVSGEDLILITLLMLLYHSLINNLIKPFDTFIYFCLFNKIFTLHVAAEICDPQGCCADIRVIRNVTLC
jgi:hypothetical protein